ncbi:ABC transporter substrate-binding protein [Roseomonas sp. OT10]|uniref:ABC transporter substrate-binding protein n=1 Tax=Roseomonas cutis TaxID=2897332 RepID=UPI001E4D27D6|nr:ABC transporter substrate-binding protein [Roseomonas sp. OT10]UFN48512.1 ABC transporter substrate-binding protein [Roseomonas sp. OT10]
MPTCASCHACRRKGEGWELSGTPVGSGPWKFAGFRPGIEVTMTANEAYWNLQRVPSFATLRLLPGAQRNARLAMLRAGEADMAFVHPRLLVLDEPISALDVSVRAQVMNLLADLKAQLGMSMVLISHDLVTVRCLADEILAPRRGEVVEARDCPTAFASPRLASPRLASPRHGHTRALINTARLLRRPAASLGVPR